MGKSRNVGIVEQRIYHDPQNPADSDYDVALPITVPDAVIDPETKKTLSETLGKQAAAISAAASAAETAKSAADEVKVKIDSGAGVPASTLGGKTAAEFAPAAHTHDDRYYTEQEINDLLAGKAASSHAHTTTDITNFPTSLPANGGNADTVDGAHVVTDAEPGLHRMASGTAAATSANCPPGTWYSQYE